SGSATCRSRSTSSSTDRSRKFVLLSTNSAAPRASPVSPGSSRRPELPLSPAPSCHAKITPVEALFPYGSAARHSIRGISAAGQELRPVMGRIERILSRRVPGGPFVSHERVLRTGGNDKQKTPSKGEDDVDA